MTNRGPQRIIVPGRSIGEYALGSSIADLPDRVRHAAKVVRGAGAYELRLRGVSLWIRSADKIIMQIGARKESGAVFVGGLAPGHKFSEAFEAFGEPREHLETYVFRGLPFTVMETTDVKERYGWDEKRTRITAVYVYLPDELDDGPRLGQWEGWFDSLPR